MANQMMLAVSYTLNPPSGTNPPSSLKSTSSHSFAIENSGVASSNREYYRALRNAITAAKDRLGEELTAWRDAVGNAELGKEKAVKAARAEDEEEEDGEE